MPLQIVRNDITKMHCDAIVNAANRRLLAGGGVDGAIHAAAGPELDAACCALGGCEVGQAKLTGGYRLPCKYVIHTVGPRWIDGKSGETQLLISCYRESLRLAKEQGCESVAFPLIATGAYGFPKDQALRLAVNEISGFLMENEMLVYLVVYDPAGFRIGKKLFSEIAEYIDEYYVQAHPYDSRPNLQVYGESTVLFPGADASSATLLSIPLRASQPTRVASSLEDAVRQIDESFSQMLLRKIDERGMTDAACYKKANIDRKLFSKIRSDVHYRPSKATALAFAIALELPLDETKNMLMKAGYALSHSSKFDIIVEYFIAHGVYDIFQINEALFAFDQSLLGA